MALPVTEKQKVIGVIQMYYVRREHVFTQDEIDLLLNPEELNEGLVDADECSEVDEENVVSKLGDVWILGKHRLMCGDSTMIDSVETVKRSKVRRAKLYHIRDKAAKEIRRQMRNIRSTKDTDIVAEDEAEVVETKSE